MGRILLNLLMNFYHKILTWWIHYVKHMMNRDVWRFFRANINPTRRVVYIFQMVCTDSSTWIGNGPVCIHCSLKVVVEVTCIKCRTSSVHHQSVRFHLFTDTNYNSLFYFAFQPSLCLRYKATAVLGAWNPIVDVGLHQEVCSYLPPKREVNWSCCIFRQRSRCWNWQVWWLINWPVWTRWNMIETIFIVYF